MAAASVKSDEERFAEWMKEYNKEYKTEAERDIRFSAFKENLRRVETHLADTDLKRQWMGLGYFSDMTIRQFITEHRGCTGSGGGIADDSDTDTDEDEGEGELEFEVEVKGDVPLKR